MIVGDKSAFAIESGTIEIYESQHFMALGYFILHINGKSHGERTPDATMLGNPFYDAQRRLSQRGLHRSILADNASALHIVDAYRAFCWGSEDDYGPGTNTLLEAEAASHQATFRANEVDWDGDAAFDDGSVVLQFDVGAKVRLISFMRAEKRANVVPTVIDFSLDAGVFYDVLDQWSAAFAAERLEALNRGEGIALPPRKVFSI